jgi:hypothetical protein
MVYYIFKNPSVVETNGVLAWASGLWKFLTPAAVEVNYLVNGYFTEI